MITNRFIIIPFVVDFNWSTDYQWQTALELSRHNLVTAYCEYKRIKLSDVIRRKKKIPHILTMYHGVFFYTPIDVLPFVRFAVIKRINGFLNHLILVTMLRINPYRRKIILWGFHPGIAVTERYYPFPHMSVYDCVDYYSSLLPDHEQIIRQQEQYIMRNFSVMTVNSNTLYRLHKADRPDAAIVPLGFSPPLPIRRPVFRRDHVARPVIGYIGGLNYRLDFVLLHDLIRRNSQWDFVFWGPILTDGQDVITHTNTNLHQLLSLPNVRHGHAINQRDLFAVLRSFSVCIIPYNTSYQLNAASYPAKLMEYFYAGKPIVSTAIAEAGKFVKYVRIGKTVQDWESHISAWLHTSFPASYRRQQRHIAMQNSWKNKIDAVSDVIERYERAHD